MSVSKNYQKALEICDEFQEFQIIEYIKGKSPKLKLRCLKCGHEFERYQCHFIQYPHICPKCHPKGSNQYITLEEAQKRVDDVYGKEYLVLLEYRGNNELINVQCKKCSQIFQSIPANLWRGRVKGCPFCEKTISLGEAKIERFLREYNIQYRREERFQDCRDKLMLPFDFYLPQYNVCIEFQGEQHTNKKSLLWSPDIERHDAIKKEYCITNNIQLIEIPYYDIDNIEKYFTFIRG